MFRFLISLTLAGCATVGTFEAPSPRAQVRRFEAQRLIACLNIGCTNMKVCIHESAQRCRGAGLEATCATDSVEAVDCK